MSKAVVDGSEFRVDVFTDDWERVLAGSKKVSQSLRLLVGRGEATVDGSEHRVDVFTHDWKTVIARMKKQ